MSKFGDLIRGIKAAPAPTPEPVVEAPAAHPRTCSGRYEQERT